MGSKKILMLFGDCVEDYEVVMFAFKALEMVGHVVPRGLARQAGRGSRSWRV